MSVIFYLCFTALVPNYGAIKLHIFVIFYCYRSFDSGVTFWETMSDYVHLDITLGHARLTEIHLLLYWSHHVEPLMLNSQLQVVIDS